MNKFLTLGLTCILASMISGCAAPRYADVPAPTRFENSEQKKLQAAQHWQAIADHFANELAGDLVGKLNNQAIYVPQPGGEQAFVEGFRELLITALVRQGLPVSTEAQAALIVDVRYSIYRFRPERLQDTYFYGNATALAAGLWAFGGLTVAKISPVRAVSAGAKLLTAAAGLEGFRWLTNNAMEHGKYTSGDVPRSEILLTASVANTARIVSRRTNIYYTADEDDALYWDRTASARQASTHNISVVGDCTEGGKKCAR